LLRQSWEVKERGKQAAFSCLNQAFRTASRA
jgi:hypothetical protein